MRPMIKQTRSKQTRRQIIQVTSAFALAAVLPRCAPLAEQKPPRERVAFGDIPRSDYGFATTADEIVAGMDLSGMTALITGCNSGLGYESLRTLAAAGAHVIGAARTMEKAEQACNSVTGKTTPVVCELTSMDSVVACADAVHALDTRLDILMCNAGIMALPELEQVTIQASGGAVVLEKQFVVNHLGHYLLTRRLLPVIEAAPQGRIVMVSSGGYSLAPQGGIQFDNLSGESAYQPFRAYGQSKLANILMSNELSVRFFSRGITANSIAPGVVATNLGRYISGKMRDPDKPLGKGQKWPDQGAATQVYVATDPRLANVSGYYFEDCNPLELKGPYATDAALAARLWDVSAELVEPYLS
jgi:NAD(P)-dependent dehydrogenase (short-subunit alcohol dehydrogenase family)